MGSDRLPSACYGVGAGTILHSGRIICSIVCAKEFIADGIKAIDLRIYRVYSIVITTLSVFGFVENRGIYDFNFAGTEVTLEVLHIIIRIP